MVSTTTRNATPANHSFPQFHQMSQHTIRSFSTQFREDYDALYSHGCTTGIQTQSDQRSLYFGDNIDIVTFGVNTNKLDRLDDYDLEDNYLDYSEDEFEGWFPTRTNSKNDTTVSVEKMTFHPDPIENHSTSMKE